MLESVRKLNRIRLALRAVFLRRRLEREMQEEMATHLAEAADRLTARGLNAEDARRAAGREFGNVQYLQELARDARGARWLESILADLQFGIRHFLRTPVSTLTMVVLLALGIGFNIALFTVFYSFAYMPPPGMARDAALYRIRGLDRSAGAGRTLGREFSYPEYRAYQGEAGLFSAVAAWTSADVVLALGDGQDDLHSGAATYVTGNYFQVLGVRPLLGAGLPAGPDADQAEPQLVGIISHLVWDRHFGRAPDVLGRRLKVNDVAVTIVGVAPERFAGARTSGSQMRVWLPLSTRPLIQRGGPSALSSYDSALFSLAARLRPGVAVAQTGPTVEGIAARTAQQSERGRSSPGLSTDVVALLGGNYYPPSGEAANVLGRATSLLIPLLILLIPCTNVSALLVGLAVARRREIAVRLSLGAARHRIVRQLITESVLLSLAAGALGLFVIWVLLSAFGARVPDVQLALHWPAFVFTFAIAIATGILFGVSPALNATRVSVMDVLKNAATGVASARSRLQSGLVVAQIAMTQPLLLGLGALILALLSDVQRLPAPENTDRILQISFNSNARNAPSDPQREAMLRGLQERLAALPGVEAVVPQHERDDYIPVAVHPTERVIEGSYQDRFHVRTQAAPPGFFSLMEFPFVRGRGFERADPENALVIRADLARRLWGPADPIGRRLVLAGGGATAFVIVGVVDEKKAGISGDDARVFVPALNRTGSILVRTRGPAAPMIQLIQTVARAEAPLLPVTRATTLAAIDASQRTDLRRALTAAAGGGLVALFLCAIGLYALVSFAVSQRMREIGIRSALGADAGQVVALFFRRGLRLSLAGLLIGLTLSAIMLRIIALAEGRNPDSGILPIAAVIAAVVLSVATIATWIPARRAASVDPLATLRAE